MHVRSLFEDEETVPSVVTTGVVLYQNISNIVRYIEQNKSSFRSCKHGDYYSSSHWKVITLIMSQPNLRQGSHSEIEVNGRTTHESARLRNADNNIGVSQVIDGNDLAGHVMHKVCLSSHHLNLRLIAHLLQIHESVQMRVLSADKMEEEDRRISLTGQSDVNTGGTVTIYLS